MSRNHILILDHFKKPFPLLLNKWRKSFIASLFVGVFLYLFKPYGLTEGLSNPDIVLWGYSLLSFVVSVITHFILPIIFKRFYNKDKWNHLRQYIHQYIILITISTLNFWYTYQFTNVFNKPHSFFSGFIYITTITFGVAVFLFIGFNMVAYNRSLKKNIKEVKKVNNFLSEQYNTGSNHTITLASEKNTNRIIIPVKELLYIEVDGNYLNIYYNSDDEICKKVIRNSLKNAEKKIKPYLNLFRCHRAYIVNLKHVEKVGGNAQGYRLLMDKTKKEIPVSRNYNKTFTERMDIISGKKNVINSQLFMYG